MVIEYLIKRNGHFQPSTQSLEKWLSTRKSSSNVGGVLIPQFFGDKGNGFDSFNFGIACFIELIGLIFTVYGGFKNGGIFLIFAILLIIMFIALDFYFAVLLHKPQSKINKCIALILLYPEREEVLMSIIKKLKNSPSQYTLKSLIIIIAAVKVIGIVLLGVFSNILIYIPFAVFYFIAALIHIKNTGYFFSYYSTQNSFNKEYNEFIRSNNRDHGAVQYTQLISTRIPVRSRQGQDSEILVQVDNNKIVKDLSFPNLVDNDNQYRYKLEVLGVLIDRDIERLMNGQDITLMISLFKHCRSHQVSSYGIDYSFLNDFGVVLQDIN